MERHQDAAYAYAFALLGDRHLAEDAAQEAFLTAYRNLDQLREPDAFPGWLRRIVRTQCGRIRRRAEPTVPGDMPPEPNADPAVLVEMRELQALVAAALNALPARERVVTLLHYVAGHRQQRIARFLGVPVNTVKKRLQAARKRLQERMLDMAQDALKDYGRAHRPSRDARFAETLRFLTAFDAATAAAETPLVELLLVDGMDVDAQDDSGRTLLSLAAQRGQAETAELLLRHGADVNAPDRSGMTPLAWAERAGQREVAALLRRRGAMR